jgi:hypothetical protein
MHSGQLFVLALCIYEPYLPAIFAHTVHAQQPNEPPLQPNVRDDWRQLLVDKTQVVQVSARQCHAVTDCSSTVLMHQLVRMAR